MIRQAVRGLVVLAAMMLLVDVSAKQPGPPEKVYVRDKKDGTTKSYEGSLKFGPTGFQVVAPGKTPVAVAPDDLVKVVPNDLPGSDRNIVLGLITAEEKKTKAEYEKARLGYADLQKKATTPPEATRRFLSFKYAQMATKVADESADDEKWAELAGVAMKSWDGFLADYKTGWEVWPATRAQARLLTEVNKHDEVARLWARTAKTAELPADLKLEANLRALDAEIRSKGYASALVSAEALGKTTGPGGAKDKLAIYELAAKAAVAAEAATDAAKKTAEFAAKIKEIEAAVAATKDPGARGVGYGMIGELQLLAGKPREAMWAFLWVETVYSQDKDDALNAMCRLVEVFKAQGDEDRAKAYREKIRRFRETF